ncbi:MAG: hypothetical protein JRG91_10785 [Deltaproteobacteria bacterium]|nr:hypothetical protein [Deltaproteobacteria bacterium]
MVNSTIRPLAAVMALFLLQCGVDRMDPDAASVRIMFGLDGDHVGRGGGAARDAQGVFDLEEAGIYLMVKAHADDMEPVIEDWPDAEVESVPDQVELTMTVKAGSDRTFEALVLVLDDGGALSAYSGRRTVDELPGGTEYEMDPPLALEEQAPASVEAVLELPAELAVDDVRSVHAVDVELDVRYPAAEFTPVGVDLEVRAAALAPGRSVTWSVLTASAEWVDLEQETSVP